jgi:predicted ATPase/class 3 adenylate cyclase
MTTMTQLPTGTVTFLFTDIEGSTRLVERLGTSAWMAVLADHQAVIRAAVDAAGGHEIATEGDSFFVVFDRAEAGLEAAITIQRGLAAQPWPDGVDVRVRIGLHTGEGVVVSGNDYVGLDVHRAARIAAAGHGGQTLLSAATAALVAETIGVGISIRDRGEHRLKDLSRPERLAEVVIDGLPSDFPTLRTLESTPNNLPTQLTSFLGRSREIGEILELLRSARLLSLTGPGGTGKTRLSLEVAGQAVDRFPDGVYFVPLAAIDSDDLVAPTIARAIGLPEHAGRSPVEGLIDHLRDRRVLLILDNFEQVVSAAPTVARLLAGAPGLTVLVTTRSLLKVYGEREFPVPPLEVPEQEDAVEAAALGGFEAVRLFVERAMAVRPDFRLTDENAGAVAGIARRLDGLPLALEIAAARIRLLPAQAILARLQGTLDLPGSGAVDLPARQQTLRGAITWSHDLLEPPDRELFAALSVFVSGADIDAIEAVCGADPGSDVLERLGSLVDQSLVRAGEGVGGEPRFSMLQTIREFALERLAEGGRAADLRARHADQYCSLVERARGVIMGRDKRRWLDVLEQEHDNIRAAFAWSVEVGDTARLLRLSAGLWRFWQMRGYLEEGAERAELALAQPGTGDMPSLLADALEAAGGLRYWQGRHGVARGHYERALAIRRSLGDTVGEAEQLYNLSFTYAFGDNIDPERSLELTGEALELFRAAGNQLGIAKALWALANGEFSRANAAAAKQHGLDALPLFEAAGDEFMVAWSEYLIAVNEFALNEPIADSARRLRRAMAIFVDAGDVSGYVLVLDTLSFAAQATGDLERAARIAGGVAALEASSGTGLNVVNRRIVGYDPKALRSHPAWSEGYRMPIGDLVRYALAESPPA